MTSSARISWHPAGDPAVKTYQVFRAESLQGPFWVLGTISADMSGPNYDINLGKFFFDDPNGAADLFYKVSAFNAFSVAIAESTPFTPSGVQNTSLVNKVRIDQDFGGVDALRYISPGGAPVPQADIRIYRQPDYVQGNLATPYAILQTRDDGRWVTPVYLPPGMNYVIQFFKASGYGPDTVTITV